MTPRNWLAIIHGQNGVDSLVCDLVEGRRKDAYLSDSAAPELVLEKLDTFVETQKKRVTERWGKEALDGLLVVDNFPLEYIGKQSLRELFLLHQNLHMNVLMVYPEVQRIAPFLRMNVDYVFIMPDNRLDRELLYKQYGGIYETLEEFSQALDDACTQNLCLILHLASRSIHKEDIVMKWPLPST